MDFKPENTIVNPTALVEGVVEESSNAVNLEVVETLSMTSTFLNDTEASKPITSNMDNTVPVEDKSDNATINISRSREFPDVSKPVSSWSCVSGNPSKWKPRKFPEGGRPRKKLMLIPE